MNSNKQEKVAILYQRLSKDDELNGESNSIQNQRRMLEEYAERNSFTPYESIAEMITPSLIQYNYSSLAFILGCIFSDYNNFAPKCTQMHLYSDYESCLIICSFRALFSD